MGLRMRPATIDDERAVVAAHEDMAVEGFNFCVPIADGEFSAWLERTAAQRNGTGLTGRLVPCTFLLVEVDGVLVGRTSIRHDLNDFLRNEGGHIGYGVLAAHRRRGYATEILRQSLVIARSYGVDAALLTCDDDNVGSAAVIERCGGVLEDRVVNEKGVVIRRYWID